MRINEIIEKVDGKLLIPGHCEKQNYAYAFASDLMSDVLTLSLGSDETILITGLCTTQTLRTANVADIHTVIIARGKKVTEDMIELAKDYNICLIESPMSIFRCCVAMHEVGLKPIY